MSAFGLLLLVGVGLIMILTGLPAFAVLLFASAVGAIAAVASGTVPVELLNALPTRVINLFEHDLLQALPLYVLAGVLLDRMAVAPALFRLISWLLPRGPAAPLFAGLGLGALLGPMNGSVGASVLGLSRSVAPRLAESDVPPATRQALVAVAATLGVVIPPSLVLILLGDAMLNAHTIAINQTGRADRIVNTQDVLRGALAPAAIFLAAALVAAWISAGRSAGAAPPPAPARPSAGEVVLSLVSLASLVVLLGGVAVGYFYAVEAAATAAFVLLLAGLATRRITPASLGAMLSEVMATTGALFAPLLAATTFTLVLRLLGTDKLVAAAIEGLPGGNVPAVVVTLLAITLSAFVLDAFEIIFVVVPIVVPPLLVRVPDATWIAVLVLLTLQASFLLPPVGYALMMARATLGGGVALTAMLRALAPFLAAQATTLAIVIAAPGLVHLLEPSDSQSRGAPAGQMSPEDLDKALKGMLPVPGAGPSLPSTGPSLPVFEPAKP